MSLKVDCKWQNHGEWSDCSVTCGNGTKVRYRQIIQQAENGGIECSGNFNDTKVCNTNRCKCKLL